MKKGNVKAIALLLCLLLTLTLAGCGSNLGTMLIVSRAAKALETVQSLGFALTLEDELPGLVWKTPEEIRRDCPFPTALRAYLKKLP